MQKSTWESRNNGHKALKQTWSDTQGHKTHSSGFFYEIDQSKLLAPRTPEQLKQIQIVLVNENAFLKGSLSEKQLRSLDEEYVMAPEMSSEMLYLTVKPREIAEQTKLRRFWAVQRLVVANQRNNDVIVSTPTALSSGGSSDASRMGTRCTELTFADLVLCGKSRQVRYLREPSSSYGGATNQDSDKIIEDDSVNIRTTPPDWKLGHNPTGEDPICSREIKDYREEEMEREHMLNLQEDHLAIATTPHSLTQEVSFTGLKEMYTGLIRKTNIQEQLMKVSQSLSEIKEQMGTLKTAMEEPGLISEAAAARTLIEDKAAKIERLRSGFRICKPQGTLLWPNMGMSRQRHQQIVFHQTDPFTVPTPPSASSSNNPTFPVLKPLVERRPVNTFCIVTQPPPPSPIFPPPPINHPLPIMTPTKSSQSFTITAGAPRASAHERHHQLIRNHREFLLKLIPVLYLYTPSERLECSLDMVIVGYVSPALYRGTEELLFQVRKLLRLHFINHQEEDAFPIFLTGRHCIISYIEFKEGIPHTIPCPPLKYRDLVERTQAIVGADTPITTRNHFLGLTQCALEVALRELAQSRTDLMLEPTVAAWELTLDQSSPAVFSNTVPELTVRIWADRTEDATLAERTEDATLAERTEDATLVERTEDAPLAERTEDAQLAEFTEEVPQQGIEENAPLAERTEDAPLAEFTEQGIEERQLQLRMRRRRQRRRRQRRRRG